MSAPDSAPVLDPPAAPVPAFAEEVAALAAGTEELLQGIGRADLAESVREGAGRRSAGPATVVVVGETNRGKSALVNALVGHFGLSPVDSDVATNCYVEIKHTAAGEEYARAYLAGTAEPVAIAVAEIADWATVAGNPGNEKGVRSVEVGLANPFLEGMRLIDTPGVGGLEAAHANLTLEVLHEADALLFVIDTDGPLSAPELHFLERAAERIDTVIIALTKIDAERRWEELRSEDATLLRTYAPRFAGAPIVPVSSLRYEQSFELDPEQAARRRVSSGIDELKGLIELRVVRRAAVLHLSNTTRICQGALAAVRESVAERVSAVDRDPAFEEQMKAKQEQLQSVEEALADWQDRLSAEMELMALNRNSELTNSMRALQRQYLERAEKTKVAQQNELVADLEAELSALARRLAYASAESLSRTLEEMLGITGDEEVLAGTVGRLRDEVGAVSSLAEPPGKGSSGPGDSITAASGFMMGTRIPTLAHMVLPSIMIPGGAVVAVAGVAWMALSRRARVQASTRAELSGWIRDQLAEATAVMRDDFNARMISVRQEVKRINRQQVAERRKAIAAAQKEYREAAAATISQRERRKKQLAEQANRIRTLLASAEQLQGQLASVGTPAAPAPESP